METDLNLILKPVLHQENVSFILLVSVFNYNLTKEITVLLI